MSNLEFPHAKLPFLWQILKLPYHFSLTESPTPCYINLHYYYLVMHATALSHDKKKRNFLDSLKFVQAVLMFVIEKRVIELATRGYSMHTKIKIHRLPLICINGGWSSFGLHSKHADMFFILNANYVLHVAKLRKLCILNNIMIFGVHFDCC